MDPNIKTYIGKRGYVLIKKHFSADFLDNLKKQLTVKPNTNDDYGAPAEEFPVFTENKNKLYIPKFFGFNNPQLGKPQLNRVPHGQDIDAKFNGKLRPHQVEPVNVALKSCQEKGGGILALPCAFGKCMGKGTPIIMYNGSIKMVEDVQVGDLLMGDDSKPRKVLSLARGQDEMYKIKQNNGNDFVVNQEHILCLKSSPKYCSINGYKMNKGDIIEISVKDYLNLPKSYVYSRGRPLRCYKVGVNFPEKEVDLDPYMLGYWLGDGSKSKPLISTQESKVLIYFREKIKEMGLYFDYYKGSYDYQITSGRKYYDKNSFLKSLQNYNLLYNKHVPDEYKYNSRDIRLKVLAGLIDSDGYFIKGVYDFTLKDERLIDDIIYLGRSLGFVCSNKRSCQKTCTNAKNGPKTGTYFKTSIFGYGLEEIPVLCTRKKASKRQLIKNPLLSGFEVEHIGRGDYYGFTLDGNGRYLLEDFTVTHNTSLSLYILSQLGKKALVIVHKEFLLNQWKERIEQFLPEARIGIIQQDKVDIDNKDIVIAMLQSISMKEYAMDTFDGFSLVIIDEVHHISSKVFSRALRKINSQYMIGLSATPNRKDGLTKVFKWYIGDVIYHKKHEDVNTVHVERLIIKSDNEYYNKECINFRGKVMMPKMINNICENMNRTRVIIHWVKELLEEDRKIIILSDRRQHLEDMNKLLYESKIKSVGFYVGGMKQKDLDISAQKNIILGTFAIASEGLDIPGLDTIFLTSPKSDVVQAIGRILRKKHEELIPKIIDIVDTFSLFETQANKRNRLYRQRKYIINDIIVWDMLDANGEPQIESNIQQKYNNKSQNLNDEKTFKKQFSNNFMFSTTSTPVKENNKPLSQSKISDFHS